MNIFLVKRFNINMGNNKKVFLAYLTGLFSVKDAILNCSMESIIKDLYITDEVKENLIGD